VGFFAIAAIAMWVGVQPDRMKDDDDEDGEHASNAALALVDLPMEAAKKIIQERPIAAIVLVSGFGLLIARRPQIALKVVDKILERFGG
jgi:selenophosphate synthase